MAKKSIMGQFDQDDREDKTTITAAPKFCHAIGCKNETDFVMAKVSSHRGIEHRAASDVMTWERIGKKTIFEMLPGFVFIGWFSRCAECARSGRERMTPKLRERGWHEYYLR